MARQFDGTDDRISFGANLLDDTQQSVVMWIDPDDSANATDDLFTRSDGAALTPTGFQFSRVETAAVSTGHLQLTRDFTLADGTWVTANNSVPEGELRHVGYSYDRSGTGNDPNIYIDGTLQAETETSPPNGASSAQDGTPLIAGEDNGGNSDYAGAMGWLVYEDSLLTAADMNRHRWWGVAPGGPSTVQGWQPMWTDSLVNKGTGETDPTDFDGTATGTTMQSLPKVERMWAGCMGVGR